MDIEALQAEVEAASERVQKLYNEFPAHVASLVEDRMRKIIHISDPCVSIPTSYSEPSQDQLSNPRLSHEMDERVSQLRVRLENAYQKLGRIVTAIEEEHSKPEPRTVEKVLLKQIL